MLTGILVPGGTGNVQTALLDLGWEALPATRRRSC
jgi:hypothetical protein